MLSNQISQLEVYIFHIHLLRGVFFCLEPRPPVQHANTASCEAHGTSRLHHSVWSLHDLHYLWPAALSSVNHVETEPGDVTFTYISFDSGNIQCNTLSERESNTFSGSPVGLSI